LDEIFCTPFMDGLMLLPQPSKWNNDMPHDNT
jgi:hypothetical protein